MTLHLIKLCVGVDTIRELECVRPARVKRRMRDRFDQFFFRDTVAAGARKMAAKH